VVLNEVIAPKYLPVRLTADVESYQQMIPGLIEAAQIMNELIVEDQRQHRSGAFGSRQYSGRYCL